MANNQDDITFRLRADGAAELLNTFSQISEQGRQALDALARGGDAAGGIGAVIEGFSSGATGALEGMAGRAGLLGDALAAAGPAGLALGAAIGVLSAVMASGVRGLEAGEVVVRRLNSTLRATGGASGVIAEEIKALGDTMERATLAQGDAVVGAASKIAVFRNVGREAHSEVLSLAEDWRAVFGGDLEAAAVRIARVLDDPVRGLDALKEANINLSAAQKQSIRDFDEIGDRASAQKVVIDAVKTAVGGAGADAKSGLTGAWDAATKAASNFSKALAEVTGVGTGAERAANILAADIQYLTDQMKGLGAESSAAMEGARQVAEKEAAIHKIRKMYRLDQDETDAGGATARARQEVAQLQAEIDAIVSEGRVRAEFKADLNREISELDEMDSADAQRKQAATRNAEAQKQRLKDLAEARIAASTDAAEKIRAVETKLSEDIGKVRARAALPGVDPADTEKEIALLRDIAQRKIAALEEPQRQAAQRMQEQTARVLDDLQRQLSAVADKRGAAVEAALARLPSSATPDQRDEAAMLAGAAFDARQAVEEAKKAEADLQKLRERGRQVTLQSADAETVYATRLRELQQLRDTIDTETGAPVLPTETYSRAVIEAEKAKLAAARDWSSGVRRALDDYVDASTNAAARAERFTAQALRQGEDFFVNTMMRRKASAADFFNFIAEQAMRSAYQMSGIGGFMSDLMGAGGGLIKDALGLGRGGTVPAPANYSSSVGVFGRAHTGGMVSGSLERVSAPRSLWAAAPRYHSGGVVGLRADERPIIARDGEAVFTPRQMDTADRLLRGAMAGGGAVNLTVQPVVTITAPGVSARTEAAWRGGQLEVRTIVEQAEGEMADRISRGVGALAPAIEGRYGLSTAARGY